MYKPEASCEAFNSLFLLDAQNEIKILARFLSYSWPVCLLVFWLRNSPLVKVIGNPSSDGSLLLTIPLLNGYYKQGSKKSQAILMAFRSILTGKPELLLYLMCFSFSGFLKSSVVSAPSLCTRQ